MANTIVGNQDPIEQGREYTYKLGGGHSQRQVWKVTDQADVATLVSALAISGYSYSVQYDGQIATVEGTLDYNLGGAPTTTPLTTIWERDIKIVSEDILKSDLAIIGGISSANKKTIQEKLKTPEDPSATGLTSDALTIYTLMFNGVTSRIVYQPMIRRTKLCANSYAAAESDTNMGKILTAAQMSSLEGAPGGLLFALPASGTNVVRSDISTITGYLKVPCRVQQQGDGRWQITQEWDYGVWAAALYTAA
jgi:hypothetical protein